MTDIQQRGKESNNDVFSGLGRLLAVEIRLPSVLSEEKIYNAETVEGRR